MNRAARRRQQFAVSGGWCQAHDHQIKRGTTRCQRCRKLARKKR